MNNFDRNVKKQIDRKRLRIWTVSIAIAILLITLDIYKNSEIIKGLHKDTEVIKKTNTESYNSEKVVKIIPKPSEITLNEIQDWVNKDEKDGEQFKYYNYALTQYYGIHIGMADAILSQIGEVKDANDAKDVIALIGDYSNEFSNSLNELKENEKNGIIPPKFIITQVESQITEFSVKDIKKNNIYLAFNKKLIDQNINDKNKQQLLKDMEKVLRNKIYPGYDKLLSCIKRLEGKADNEAGVWKFKNGDAYYAYVLKHNISVDMTPQEVYDLGIQEIDKIQADMGTEFKKLGYSGTLKENMKSLNNDTRFLYPGDKAGDEQVLDDYKKIINDMNSHIGDMFDLRPTAGIEVLPITEFTEESAPQAYYYPSLTGGDVPGIFYVNVSKPTYKYDMQSIAYHEAVPGHHLQMALQQELLLDKYPDKASFYIPAYVEGWGLYAESLADEYGMYKDSYSRLGYLRGELLRSLRLVIDTGIHYKKWTREYAIEYMTAFSCIPDEYVTAEIDRYIVNPGQACAYKIGEMKIIELREKARAELGDKFNIKDFHNIVLRNGPMPLVIMEKEVQGYIDLIKKNQ